VPSETVRIPCSATRASQRFWAKLLTSVDPDAQSGYGFEGSVLRPGATVPLEALWPTPAHPEIPIVLECAGAANPERGHRRNLQANTYLLWRFDPVRKTWSEIARSASESWTWAIDLRPIAIRALEESRGKAVEIFAGMTEVTARVSQLLDVEIRRLPPPDRVLALAVLHDEFCIRIARLAPVDATLAGSLRFPG
jgi:hypothetical protein